eukprot:CAMPEP_0198311218 /NCGR_PEP_ID=MMETSP1450-20131203/3003_1 /TAXON_ID=753684 ORGANISM="Madagascaria erythrocladiodes, Strain CCMP3234" /NCGR_SAMPLE_ID=MMETSP1450 /ASSEMBLY_ACC=CAM_ASM_001115 /LENGTH=493 /DNA_ID=CAMNT_0044014085 /DNA_START=26 /DNA_END=1504 /DNA_ORIENTATION=+
MRAPTAIIIAIAITLGATAQHDCFQQVGDHIIIQAEDVAINNPLWVVGNNISGYSGSGYITWTGENRFFWVGNDVLDGILRYPINVEEAGTYLIKMYTCRTNDFECPGADKCNDVFVVAGGEMTKLYTGLGNTREVWRYTSRFDRESGHVEAYTELKAGPQEFVIAARSQGFAIDRIEITKQSSPPGLTETTKASCTYGVVQPETPCGPASSSPIPEYHINLTVTNYKPNPMAVYSYDESGAVGPETVVPVGEAASFDANIYSYWVMEEILADSTRKCSRYLYLNDYKPFRNMFPGGATPRTPVPTPVSTSLPESQSPSPSPNPEPVAPSSCGSANSIATGVSVDMQVVNWKNSPITAYSYGVDGTETLVDSIWPGQSKTFPTSKYSYWVLKKSGLCFKNFYVAGSGAVETYKYGTKAPAASVTADPPALPATKCGSGVSTPVVGNLVTLQIVNRKSRQLKVFKADGTGALSRQVTVPPGETIEIPAEQFTYW